MSQDLLQRLQDPLYLPTIDELKTVFPIEQTFKTDSKEFPYLSPQFSKQQVKLNNYQVYTQEFIESLGAYLFSRKMKIVEVGAGDGRLTRFLKSSTYGEMLDITASDSMEWEENGQTNQSQNVEKLGYIDVIKTHSTQPLLMLSCWMNVDVAWTTDFRSEPMVKEYILIGDIFRTANYGSDWYLPEESGFECTKLTRADDGSRNGIITGSIGRFDGSPHNPESRTEVYSFKRI